MVGKKTLNKIIPNTVVILPSNSINVLYFYCYPKTYLLLILYDIHTTIIIPKSSFYTSIESIIL